MMMQTTNSADTQLCSNAEINSLPVPGKILLDQEKISLEEIKKAAAMQDHLGGSFASVLIRTGTVPEETVLTALAEALHIPFLPVDQLPDSPSFFLQLIESSNIELSWWLDRELLCWEGETGEIFSLFHDVPSPDILEALQKIFVKAKITPCLTTSYGLEKSLAQVSSVLSAENLSLDSEKQLRELAEEAPVIEFVNNLFSQAYADRASDIHVEPDEQSFDVRFRIDGILFTRYTLAGEKFPAISSRIKLISSMDIAERRLPQDGRISVRLGGEEIDIRVSTLPSIHGESIVLRLLTREGQEFTLDHMGMEEDHLTLIRQWSQNPHGIIIVTGPTGSGKSTTLHAILKDLNTRKQKIITVEEPVEHKLPGITQVQAHSDIGYTFAKALRSILRQDPDVIMIGEIRDRETAEIAIQSSLTGHLVFSTLHTNDAVSAFTRLTDMGIEPFLVAAPLRGVMAQRLVRRLCSNCARPAKPEPELLSSLAGSTSFFQYLQNLDNWKEPHGCPDCQSTGYRGRTGIFELVTMTPRLRELVLSGASWSQLKEAAALEPAGRTLRLDGLLKAGRGITSIEEIMRITTE